MGTSFPHPPFGHLLPGGEGKVRSQSGSITRPVMRRSGTSIRLHTRCAPWPRRRPTRHWSPCKPPPVHTTCHACRSEEHTSELQSLMRISYAVFCLKKKNKTYIHQQRHVK